MACRSGCRTQDHANWGECARASNISIGAGESAPGQYTAKSWDKELDAYKDARAQGIQPEGTSMDKISAAVKASEKMGKAYDAGSMPPAKVITKASAEVF